MNINELQKRLQEIKIENIVWIIYIVIILLSWYSNYLEKNWLLTNNQQSKKEYQSIIIFIFIILTIVYFYFLKSSYDDYKDLKITDSPKKKTLTKLSLLGSLLVAISGIIFLFIAVKDDESAIELAFN